MKLIKNSISLQIICMYLILTYVLPGTIIELFDLWPKYYINSSIDPLSLSFLIIIIIFSFMFIARESKVVRSNVSGCIKMPYLNPGLFVMACLSFYSYYSGQSSWRYKETGLSEEGSFLVFIYALTPTIIQFILFIKIFMAEDNARISKLALRFQNFLIISAMFLSANGNYTMLFAAFSTIYMLFKNRLRPIIFIQEKRPNSSMTSGGLWLYKAPSLFVLISFIGPVFAAAWFFGEMTKRNISPDELAAGLLNDGLLDWVFSSLVERISPEYVSLIVSLNKFAFSTNPSAFFEYFVCPINTFFFRINLLFNQPFEIPRPDYGSIMRINYLMITENPINPREGTSPGLLAGFIFSLPFPANFITLGAYLVYIARILDCLSSAVNGRLTLVGKFVFLFFMRPLFQSPIDLMSILDEGSLYVIALLILCFIIKKFKFQHESEIRSEKLNLLESGLID